MKILLVGAAHQAKIAYAFSKFNIKPERTFHCGEDLPGNDWISYDAFSNIHILIHALIEREIEPIPYILKRLDSMPNWTVICDEIGGGIVSIDQTERRWREETGRLCCALAERADIVERVTCGLPIRLKGADAPCGRH